MDTTVRTRNHSHLIKALALGLRIEGSKGVYRVESESFNGSFHTVSNVGGLWYCGCRWAAEHSQGGYSPTSNVYPCKHVLLAIAHELPAKKQDALIADDPALRAAAASGAQIRQRRQVEAEATSRRDTARHAAQQYNAIRAAEGRTQVASLVSELCA